MPPDDPYRPPARHGLRSILPFLLTAVAVVGLAVRLSVRDSVLATAPLYYALPLPVIAAIVLLAGLLWWTLSRTALSCACGVAGIALVAAWIAGDYFRAPCRLDPEAVRVLFWNVAHGRAGWDDVVESIRSVEADAIVLSEVEGTDASFWRARFPGFEVAEVGDRMVALAGDFVEVESLEKIGTGGSLCATVEVGARGRLLRFVVVDLESDPRVDRRGLIDDVLRVAVSGGRTPTLVMGDFNTPADSLAFETLRESFSQSFERAGRGLLVTWPIPVPVLAIDHIWVPRTLEVSCAKLRWTAQSDHAQVFVDVDPAGPDRVFADERGGS